MKQFLLILIILLFFSLWNLTLAQVPLPKEETQIEQNWKARFETFFLESFQENGDLSEDLLDRSFVNLNHIQEAIQKMDLTLLVDTALQMLEA